MSSNGTWNYLYDGASRMTQAILDYPGTTPASTQWDFAYDGAGNRTQIKQTTQPSTVTSNLTTTYDTAGYPVSATNATTGESITYTSDKIGDLTKVDSSINANDWAYTFDAFGRMTCAQQATTCTSGTRVLPTYDALDRMISRVYGSATTTYTLRGISETVAKAVTGSTTTTYASSGSGGPLAEKTGSTASFDLLNPHGDVVGLVSTAAASQGSLAYDTWGCRSSHRPAPSPCSATRATSLTQRTGQVDMGTRLYQPGLGRFTSRDSVFGDAKAPMSLNQFAYGLMNPVRL